jgi:hypothetical protein
MSAHKSPDFEKRLGDAAEAKKAALRRFQTASGPDDPAFAEREAARKAVQLAREARAIERETVKKAREIEVAERAAREAEAAAQAEREALERAREEVSAEAKRKAARDARYAARKERQRRR